MIAARPAKRSVVMRVAGRSCRHIATVLLIPACSMGQQGAPTFRTPPLVAPALDTAMLSLAGEVAKAYRTSNRDSLLDVRFRFQILAGAYDSAVSSMRDLQRLRLARDGRPQTRALNGDQEIYARAKALEASGQPLDAAVARAFAAVVTPLDDESAAFVVRVAGLPARALDGNLQQELGADAGKQRLTQGEALRLLRAYENARTHRELAPAAAAAVRADDARRYVIEPPVRVATGDGATVCAIVVRPRAAPRLPALLEFTIYADTANTFGESRRTASHGYVAVTGFSRGKLCSDGPPVIYRDDGADAAALIEWISRQPWSDGRVGMYSGSYEGFTQWAALKHRPPALKAIMAGATNGPGIDTPMEGNIFWNFIYPYPLYTTDNKTLDDSTYNDAARWRALNRKWYVSGRAYRDLDRIDAAPNPVFDEWLSHPMYDSYWQALVPYRNDFSHIDIPVLQTAGYYYGGPGAVAYYFTQHYAYDRHANHYLVIGPYDHFQAQRGVVDVLGDTIENLAGYDRDPVARVNLMTDLRYPWFDYVFKGKPKPALLADKVNYEVVRANVWRHAPSIAGMSTARLRFYLTSARVGDRFRLDESPGVLSIASQAGSPAASRDSTLSLVVDLRDRSDVDRIIPGGAVRDRAIDTANALVFVSNPLERTTEVAGFLSGSLDLVTNKRDFDFSMSVFELTPNGEYFQLPPYQARASHVADMEHRHLLAPGRTQHLAVAWIRLAAHRMEPGSRVVLVLGVIKNPGQEINYGSGKPVADETIADAGAPLRIVLSPASFIELPIAKR